MSDNMVNFWNSIRCLGMGYFFNVWHFMASAYWTTAMFGLDWLWDSFYLAVYPHVCTCQYEANDFMRYFGANDRSNLIMQACSESTIETLRNGW